MEVLPSIVNGASNRVRYVDSIWKTSEVARLVAEGLPIDSTFMEAPGAAGLGDKMAHLVERLKRDWTRLLNPSNYFSERYERFQNDVLSNAKPRIRNVAYSLLRGAQTGWVAVEYHGSRDLSIFRLLFSGVYVCDCMMPSIHAHLQHWSVGGRGGLATGLYILSPYQWHDKGRKPVWSLQGDSRRGAILLHSGNTVTDSKGCVLLGLAKSDREIISDSTASTYIVWTLIRMSELNPLWYPSLPGLRRLPPSSFIILRDGTAYER